jgi:hypothetical protein
MTINKAKKVAVRGWSFEKFSASVTNAAKKAGISLKGKMTLVRKCYDEMLTVRDTVRVISGE